MTGCSTETCVTLVFSKLEAYSKPVKYLGWKILFTILCDPAYLEPWHIQKSRHIQNTAKHLSRNILFKTLCNPDIFRNLVYSELWYILKSKHIQNPAKQLRWDILLRILCNYRRFRGPIYSKLLHIQNRCLSATPYCISYFLEVLNSISKIHGAYFNTNLTSSSLYYEP